MRRGWTGSEWVVREVRLRKRIERSGGCGVNDGLQLLHRLPSDGLRRDCGSAMSQQERFKRATQLLNIGM